jgi:hypothetical protein
MRVILGVTNANCDARKFETFAKTQVFAKEHLTNGGRIESLIEES